MGEGFLSYDDLSIIEPDALMEMGGLGAEQGDQIVAQAEVKAAEAEKAAAEQRRLQREKDRLEAAEKAQRPKGEGRERDRRRTPSAGRQPAEGAAEPPTSKS